MKSDGELGGVKPSLHLQQRVKHGSAAVQAASHTCCGDVSLIITAALAADTLGGRGRLSSSREDSEVIVESSRSPTIVNRRLGPAIVGAHLLFPV